MPFYIFRYEKSVKKIEEDDAAFQTLIAEYGEIGKKLEKEFLAEGKEREYRDLIGLIDRILDYVCKESSRARKGFGDIMGGQVLELESERLERLLRERQEEARMKGLEEGRMEGRAEGQKEGRTAGMLEKTVDFVAQLLQDGKYSATEISQIFGVPMEQVLEIKKALYRDL